MAVIQNFILSPFFMFQSGNLLSGKMSILVWFKWWCEAGIEKGCQSRIPVTDSEGHVFFMRGVFKEFPVCNCYFDGIGWWIPNGAWSIPSKALHTCRRDTMRHWGCSPTPTSPGPIDSYYWCGAASQTQGSQHARQQLYQLCGITGPKSVCHILWRFKYAVSMYF